VELMGIEPTTPCLQSRCSSQLSYSPEEGPTIPALPVAPTRPVAAAPPRVQQPGRAGAAPGTAYPPAMAASTTTSIPTRNVSDDSGPGSPAGPDPAREVPPHGGSARRSRTVLLAVVAVIALAGAACGGDDSDSSSAGDGTTTSAAGADDADTARKSTTTTTAPEPISFEEASAAYEACLVANGSSAAAIPEGQSLDELAELGSSPEVMAEMGIDPAIVTAHAACWPALDAAIDAGATPPTADTTTTTIDAALAARLAQAVQCLNERGWDFLEPGVETGPLTMAARSADFNWDDPGFLRDQQQCQQRAGMMG